MLKEKDILNVCIYKLELTKLKNDIKKSEIDSFELNFEIDTPELIRANACVLAFYSPEWWMHVEEEKRRSRSEH